MKRFATVASMLVMGCATVTPQQASNMSSMDLCDRAINGKNNKEVVYAELKSRNEDCRQYAEILSLKAQQRANDNAAIGAAGMQMMNQQNQNRQNAYNAAPRMQTCTWSKFAGDWVQTCN